LPEVRKENSENNQISIFGSNKKPKALKGWFNICIFKTGV
jgi:hypothetical protein